MTPVTENVRRLVAGIDAAVAQLRWLDTAALIVSIAFLVAAVALALVWTSDARALVVLASRPRLRRAALVVAYVALAAVLFMATAAPRYKGG